MNYVENIVKKVLHHISNILMRLINRNNVDLINNINSITKLDMFILNVLIDK